MQIWKKECFTNVKQEFLLYHWSSSVTLEIISLIPLARSPDVNPLAVKLLDNRLYIMDLDKSNMYKRFFLNYVTPFRPKFDPFPLLRNAKMTVLLTIFAKA